MPGIAIVAPTSFGDSALPKIDVRPVAPLAGARYDWAVDRLSLGPLPVWYDMARGAKLEAPASPSQKPLVYENLRKVVRFDGVNQRMDATVDLAGGPLTLVFVGRVLNAGEQYMLTGVAGGGFNLYAGTHGKFAFFGSSTILSTVDADTSNHIFIVTLDGANSVISVDGSESTGNTGTIGATSIRVGSSSSAYFGVDVQRLAILPFAAGVGDRQRILDQMRAQYF